MAEGQATPGTSSDVNPATATLDSAMEAEIAAMEQRDGRQTGSQDDNRDDGNDAGDQEPQLDEDGNPIDPDLDADSTDADEEGDDKGDAELVDHEHEGKTYKVPKELVPALMKDADYRQKTEHIANYDRHLQGREQQVEQLFQVADYHVQGRAQLSSIDAEGQAIYGELSKDPNMVNTDPVRFSALTGQLSMLTMQRQDVIGHMQHSEQQLTAYQQQQRAERVRAAAPFLAHYGMDKPTLAKAHEYGVRSGLSPQAMKWLDDGNNPPAVLIIEKARRYDELMAKRGQATQQVREAKPVRQVARPGSASHGNNGTSRDTLGKRLATTGSVKDAVALELAHMQPRPGRRQR